MRINVVLLIIVLVFGGSACSPETAETDSTATNDPSVSRQDAFIALDYSLVSNPVVDESVLIELAVEASSSPIVIQVGSEDESALSLAQTQPESFTMGDLTEVSSAQISVIPRREGRVYVTVSAELQTADGPLIRSMAIPIRAQARPAGTEPESVPDESGQEPEA